MDKLRKVRGVPAPAVLLVAAAFAISLATLAACGAGEPRSQALSASDFRQSLRDSPPALRRLYSHGGQVLEGGTTAFERQIASLRGYPVIVNKWASWCGPCRFEFPFFQRQARKRGTKVAFLAVDGEDAKGPARDFLRHFPVPYPSFFDPDNKIAKLFHGDRAFPSTAFYDRKGGLVYTKQGGYASEAALANDIGQYAR